MLGAMLDDVEIRAFCFSPVTVDVYEHILIRFLAVVFSVISSSSNSFVMISKLYPCGWSGFKVIDFGMVIKLLTLYQMDV